MNRVNTVIFDCFGVLYGGSLSYLMSLADSNRRQEIYDINMRKDYGYISYDEYISQTAETIGKTKREIEEINQQRFIRHQEMFDLLRGLKTRNYQIGLISNMGENTYEELFPDGNELFDGVTLSFREGIVKPSVAIYEISAERLGVSTAECVMIDDLEANCEGAKLAGMESVWHYDYGVTQKELSKILELET